MKNIEKYRLVQLEEPVRKTGRRVFTHAILNEEGEQVFLFQDEKTGKETLGKLK